MTDNVTAPTTDAVAQARREVLDARDNALRNISMEAVARLDAAWDAYDTLVGAAVRAEMAVEMCCGGVEGCPECAARNAEAQP